MVAAQTEIVGLPSPVRTRLASNDKLVVVIDDDPLVLDGMGGLFRSWGFRVVTGATDRAVLSGLAEHGQPPDLIISDYRLPEGVTGVEVIERLRNEFCTEIPAFLISGDTNPEPLHEAQTGGYHLLHKPVNPMTLRAVLSQVLKKGAGAPPPATRDVEQALG